MPSFDLGSFDVICSHCGKRIRRDQQDKSVMVRIWSNKHNRYFGKGPLHAECGKLTEKLVEDYKAAGQS